MPYRYKVAHLDVRKRRDYEPALENLLNEHAAAGWRFKELVPVLAALPETFIFERED